MKKQQIVWAIVFGSMLAIGGCGDEAGDGTGGTGGNGGNGNGPSATTCEAICGSTCAFEGVDPSDMDYDQCVSDCNQGLPQFNDDCGSQADAYLGCLEGHNCDAESTQCQSEAIDWGRCLAGV